MDTSNSMHNASEEAEKGDPSTLSSRDIQHAKLVAYLAKSDAGALEAYLRAYSASEAAEDGTAASGPIPLRTSANDTIPSGTLDQTTPTPAAQNGSFYQGASLTQPLAPGRGNQLPRFDLQSVSNVRAVWAASRNGRKSAVGRGSGNKAPTTEASDPEMPKGPTKVPQERLARDHAIPLKSQPAGGVALVLHRSVLADSAPWDAGKIAELRKVCSRRGLVGFPAFTYGMSIEDVRTEVAKCFPAFPSLKHHDYAWLGSQDNFTWLYDGPRSMVTSGRNLDRFFEDNDLAIIMPMSDLPDGEPAGQDFLLAWEATLAAYTHNQSLEAMRTAPTKRLLATQLSSNESDTNNTTGKPPARPNDPISMDAMAPMAADEDHQLPGGATAVNRAAATALSTAAVAAGAMGGLSRPISHRRTRSRTFLLEVASAGAQGPGQGQQPAADVGRGRQRQSQAPAKTGKRSKRPKARIEVTPPRSTAGATKERGTRTAMLAGEAHNAESPASQ